MIEYVLIVALVTNIIAIIGVQLSKHIIAWIIIGFIVGNITALIAFYR